MPDDIEIGYSPLRMLRQAGMGAVMTLLFFCVTSRNTKCRIVNVNNNPAE